ncbi:MAG TPA: hypothetical protein VGU03_10855 [Frateuria sp.]|uniref:phage tail fiber protein n=1 Tax=Frateuria sp. TaxID=2211372 RepID=UPI002DF17253|nr:hypothetical protein [Frateuria sp.]
MQTITAANSVFALAITGLYPSPQILHGYAADDCFSTEDVEIVETVMGVDGHLSGGFIFNPTKQVIVLMPDSDSLEIFNNWALAMKATQEVLIANATVSLPAIGKKYVATRGFLTKYKPIPDVKKVLQPVRYEITWNTIVGAPL